MMRVDIGFCPDLTAPDAPTIALGYVVLDGDRFLGFTWVEGSGWDIHTVDIVLLRGIIESMPKIIQQMVEQDWPAFREQRAKGSEKEWPTNAGEYLAFCKRNSSVFVTAINPINPL